MRAFRAALKSANAVLLSSPEYAHGVPGVLKNALDWLVGSGELVGLLPEGAVAEASLLGLEELPDEFVLERRIDDLLGLGI